MICLGQPYEIGICEDWNAIAWCGGELLGWVDGWIFFFFLFLWEQHDDCS